MGIFLEAYQEIRPVSLTLERKAKPMLGLKFLMVSLSQSPALDSATRLLSFFFTSILIVKSSFC